MSQPPNALSALHSLGIFFPFADTEKRFETCDKFVKEEKFLQGHTQAKMTFKLAGKQLSESLREDIGYKDKKRTCFDGDSQSLLEMTSCFPILNTHFKLKMRK